MDQAKIDRANPETGIAAIAPIEDYLRALHDRLKTTQGGAVADYIPELSKVDPEGFGISLGTVDGEIYSVGDAERIFTIQSISKAFLYGYALECYGRDVVLEHVGVEPTGEAFNSIVLDQANNRPFNPMVNAGAIAVAEMVPGATQDERIANMLELFSRFAGRDLDINEDVFRSEKATGHRNRAIAYMMLNSGMIERDPEEVLDLYFRQCAINVTCRDLAAMGATLANDGINPLTGDQILKPDHVRDVLTVMNSCGMYNYAGQWSYEVGMPAKSGVSGGIVAVIPGQVGVAVYAPAIDAHGNSVRGVKVCQELSAEFELHAFHNRTNVRSVIRRDYRGDRVHSNRVRAPEERARLAEIGARISVIEAQGALYFGTTEVLLRRITEVSEGADYVIVDFKRVHLADASACRLISRAANSIASGGTELIFCELDDEGPLAKLTEMLQDVPAELCFTMADDAYRALEWCEDRLLEESQAADPQFRLALSELELFRGLTAEEVTLVEGLLRPMVFDPGVVIIGEGDEAKMFFVLVRGSVSVQWGADDEGLPTRRSSLGPGVTFGDMALLDGGKSATTIIAEERVVCYALAVDRLRELSAKHPNVMITILGNLVRDLSARLRDANQEISSLE